MSPAVRCPSALENTHEAIVDEETWWTAKRRRKVVRRTGLNGEPNPLTGLLYCAGCGQCLYIHRRGPWKNATKNAGNMVCESARSDYYCWNYSGGRGDCTIHCIGSKTANALILEAIKHVSHFARTNEDEFVRLLRKQADLKQAELEEQTARRREELERFDSDSLRADKFLELVRKYTDFTELTPTMLHEFVEKVIVHEAYKSSGRREQQVDIHLNFIGKFDLPAWYERSPEQPQPRTPTEEQRAKWREYKRLERERKIAAKQATQEQSA